MSDTTTKDQSRIMTANVPTLAAEHSTVDTSVEIGRNLSTTLSRNIKS